MFRRAAVALTIILLSLYLNRSPSINWCTTPTSTEAHSHPLPFTSPLACEAFAKGPSGTVYTGCVPDGIHAIRSSSPKLIQAVRTTGRVLGIVATRGSSGSDRLFFCQLGEGVKSVEVSWHAGEATDSNVKDVVSLHAEGRPIVSCNALWLDDESGDILFTDSSSLPMSEFIRDAFHAGSGRLGLVKGDTRDVAIIASGLSFANGIHCGPATGGVLTCWVAATHEVGMLHEMKIDLKSRKLLGERKHDVGSVLLDNIGHLNASCLVIGAPGRIPDWQRVLTKLPKLPATKFGYWLSETWPVQLLIKAAKKIEFKSELLVWDKKRACLVETILLPKEMNADISEGFPIAEAQVEGSRRRTYLLGSFGPHHIQAVDVAH